MSKKCKTVNISIFLDGDGRLRQIPVPNRTKLPVLAYLAGKFEAGRNYSEKQVNEIISRWHTFQDYFLLRRLLIDYAFLCRTPDGSKYWVNERRNEGNGDGQEKGTETSV